jgi:hypothetical protein
MRLRYHLLVRIADEMLTADVALYDALSTRTMACAWQISEDQPLAGRVSRVKPHNDQSESYFGGWFSAKI